MAKIKVTPVSTSGIKPFEVTGKALKYKIFDGEKIYYIGGSSYPEAIVEILEGEAEFTEAPACTL